MITSLELQTIDLALIKTVEVHLVKFISLVNLMSVIQMFFQVNQNQRDIVFAEIV